MNRPETLPEWQALIDQLAGSNLRSKAIAANSQQFAEMLLEDGYSMDDVAVIMEGLVTQMVITKMSPPGGGVWDLQGMADAMYSPLSIQPLDDDEIERMVDNQPIDPPDNVDAATEAAGLDDAWGQEMDIV